MAAVGGGKQLLHYCVSANEHTASYTSDERRINKNSVISSLLNRKLKLQLYPMVGWCVSLTVVHSARLSTSIQHIQYTITTLQTDLGARQTRRQCTEVNAAVAKEFVVIIIVITISIAIQERMLNGIENVKSVANVLLCARTRDALAINSFVSQWKWMKSTVNYCKWQL